MATDRDVLWEKSERLHSYNWFTAELMAGAIGALLHNPEDRACLSILRPTVFSQKQPSAVL